MFTGFLSLVFTSKHAKNRTTGRPPQVSSPVSQVDLRFCVLATKIHQLFNVVKRTCRIRWVGHQDVKAADKARRGDKTMRRNVNQHDCTSYTTVCRQHSMQKAEQENAVVECSGPPHAGRSTKCASGRRCANERHHGDQSGPPQGNG
jgi:hypothetical protein